jgi:hypothetical protein
MDTRKKLIAVPGLFSVNVNLPNQLYVAAPGDGRAPVNALIFSHIVNAVRLV